MELVQIIFLCWRLQLLFSNEKKMHLNKCIQVRIKSHAFYNKIALTVLSLEQKYSIHLKWQQLNTSPLYEDNAAL